MQFDKITARVSRLCYSLDPEHVDAAAITQKVISGVYQGVGTVELDNLVCVIYIPRWFKECAGSVANYILFLRLLRLRHT